MLNRIAGIVLIVIAAIVGIHTFVEPLYHTSTEGALYSPIWAVINPLSAIAVLRGLIFGYIRMSAANEDGGGAVTWERLASNVIFYGFIAIGIAFFWSWFTLLSGGRFDMDPAARAVVWMAFDALMPPFAAALGFHLVKRGG